MKIKYLVLIFMTIISVQLSAQTDLKEVKKKLPQNKSEVFWVENSNPEIKQGEYKKFNKDNLIEIGYYKNNLKDSIWITYSLNMKNGSYYKESQGYYSDGKKNGRFVYFDEDGKSPRAVGKYQNDIMINKWVFYFEGKLIQTYDFTTNDLVYKDTVTIKRKGRIMEGKYKNIVFVEKEPEYKYDMFKYLSIAVSYPLAAMENGISGTVIASFIVHIDNTISDIKIEQSVGGGCDEAIISAIKQTNGNWRPAIFNNQEVTAKMFFPFIFKLAN